MAYDLSFSESFFSGPDYYPEKSDRPTTVMQAIESLSDEEKIAIAVNVLGADPDSAHLCVDSESFNHDVMEEIRKTNTCDTLSSPITVYIDKDGWYSVTVYEELPEDDAC